MRAIRNSSARHVRWMCSGHDVHSSEESFTQAKHQVSRVLEETRNFMQSSLRSESSYDALAWEDALRMEKNEAGNLTHLAKIMETARLEGAPRVRGCILVAPRFSGKKSAIDGGLTSAGYSEENEGQWTRRVKFSDFMEESLGRLLLFRKDRTLPSRDPIPHLVSELLRDRLMGGDGLRFLILEDFLVTSLVDAMLMRRIFKGLFGYGVGLIITTPRDPGEWYSKGVQEDRLMPFVALMRSNCEVVHLQSKHGASQSGHV